MVLSSLKNHNNQCQWLFSMTFPSFSTNNQTLYGPQAKTVSLNAYENTRHSQGFLNEHGKQVVSV